MARPLESINSAQISGYITLLVLRIEQNVVVEPTAHRYTKLKSNICIPRRDVEETELGLLHHLDDLLENVDCSDLLIGVRELNPILTGNLFERRSVVGFLKGVGVSDKDRWLLRHEQKAIYWKGTAATRSGPSRG